jgi:multiple sugar transport system substrate-binding protein
MTGQAGLPTIAGGQITRREVLKRGLMGAAGLTLLPVVVAACQSGTPTPTPSSATTPVPTPMPNDFLARKLSGSLAVGTNYRDAADLGVKAVAKAFTAATGIVPEMFDLDLASGMGFEPNNYLAYEPNDVFPWFSGFRMRFFADRKLVAPIDDVWALVSDNFAAGFARSVTGNDGKVYGIPVDFYPWCMFYRPSVWAAKGYAVPTTWTELIALCQKMQKDGLTPIAFSDKDGWPAMGTFDILNLRLNGYDFHLGLMTGQEKWTDPRVTSVFKKWAELVPFYTHGYAGLTWQQACDTLAHKTTGMYFLGLFIAGEVATVDTFPSPDMSVQLAVNPTRVTDLDFFTFPFMGNEFDSEKALDAPVDIWMMPAKSPTLTADLDNARAFLEFWARGSTQLLMYGADSGYIPTASDVDMSQLDVLSRKAVSIVGQAQRIAQFMDRDTRPDFAGANAMQSFLLRFLGAPGQDLAALQKTIQAFWDALPEYKG